MATIPNQTQPEGQLLFSSEDLKNLDKSIRRELVNCLSGYKSICLMGTISHDHRLNLALMSSVIHVGANPPLMGVLFRPPVVSRHSLENILATRYFTLNHVTESIYKAAHQTSARYPETVSEFDAVGLSPRFGGLHPAPYVAESPVQIGLVAREEHRILLNQTVLIVGEIVELQLPSQVLGADGFLDLEAAGTLTVSGLGRYHKAVSIERLGYAKAKD